MCIRDRRDTLDGRGGILLYLDEIQYLNKKQQQTLLESIEDGSVTLIASTTENPYFYVYGAILSRCTVFEFRAVEPAEAARAVVRAFGKAEELFDSRYSLEDGVAEYIASACGGDVRKALNAVEALCAASGEQRVTPVSYTHLLLLGRRMSMRRLWVLISNCSRESLYLWTARRMVTISLSVGSGIGPETFAPVRLAVSTIFSAAASTSWWS